MEYLFREVQRFNFKIIWAIILSVSAILFYALFEQIINTDSFHNNPSPDLFILIITPVIGLGLPVFFLNMKMITDITPVGISIKYFPLAAVTFKITDIDKAEMREYSPLNEFGGWGVREGYKIKCYTMSGKEGVEILLKSGKKILIGTQHQKELFAALKKGMEY